MNNKCNCGCGCQQGCGCRQSFVPVNGNWDFNMDCEEWVQSRECAQKTCAREKEDRACQNRNRTAEYACEERQSCEGQNQSRKIACVCEPKSSAAQRRQHPAMVKMEMQELGEIYQAEAALKAGTLFPELHKPMRGYCPEGGLCSDARQAEAFMLWELRLYINTHPDDKEAIALFRHLCKEAGEPNYATTFLTDENCANWGWAKDPWPWEIGFNGSKCGKEGANHVCV